MTPLFPPLFPLNRTQFTRDASQPLGDGVTNPLCGAETYTWDARNRLVGFNGFTADCSPLTASFKYDALGRRIEKTINGVTTQYVYDGWDITREIQGGLATNYIRTLNIDEPLARIKTDGTVRYYQTDALGSVIALTDETGVIKTQYTYDPFGNVTVSGEASDNPFQFAGRENDGTGLLFERNRYYSFELQRYISEDPIKLAGGDINFYVRVGNGPVNRTDPFGLHWMTDPRTGQPIAHTHNPDGSINIIHPGDPGSWPGDPEHENPTVGPCVECNWSALLGCLGSPLGSPNAMMDCTNCAMSKGKNRNACYRCAASIASKAECFSKHCRVGRRDKCGGCVDR